MIYTDCSLIFHPTKTGLDVESITRNRLKTEFSTENEKLENAGNERI